MSDTPEVGAPAAHRRRWLATIGLLGTVLLACYVRLDNLPVWLEKPERYFFAGGTTPLLLGVDGYYYLDIARQLGEGGYEPHDPRRHVPAGFTRAGTPPLLSVVTAGIAGATAATLEWIAILLPAFLGALLAIPVFLLGRACGERARLPGVAIHRRESAALAMGLAAAALAVLSPFLVARSGVGWYETDALNVSFAVLAAYLAWRYADEPNARRRHFWFAGWAVNLLLYLWWWDQSHVPVLALTGVPMLVAVLHVGWRAWRDLVPLAGTVVLLLAALAWWRGPEILDPVRYWQQLGSMFAYITDDVRDSSFAAAGLDVSEQRRVSLERLAQDSAGAWPAFAAAVIGLAALAVALRHRLLYLAALGAVAALSLTASRFLIFTAPLFGLGLGFLVFLLWSRPWAAPLRIVATLALLVFGAWGAFAKQLGYNELVPRRHPVLFDAMAEVAEKTPDDAVIWSSWGHGHPMIFYTHRATMADGIYHPSEVGYMLALPLASDDPRLAANWMSFCAARGVAGLEEANRRFGDGPQDWETGMARLQSLLAAGPDAGRAMLQAAAPTADPVAIDEQLRFLFPGSDRPLFLFLDYLSLQEDWYRRGRWQFAGRSAPADKPYVVINGIRPVNEKLLRGASRAGPVAIALDQGLIRFGQATLRLGRLSWLEGKTLESLEFDNDLASLVSVLKDARFGVFTEREVASTLLHRLYFEFDFDERFFRPHAVRAPWFALWQVRGEAFASPADAEPVPDR